MQLYYRKEIGVTVERSHTPL